MFSEDSRDTAVNASATQPVVAECKSKWLNTGSRGREAIF